MSLLFHRDPIPAVTDTVDPQFIGTPTAGAASWRSTGAYQLILLQALVSILLSYQLLFSPAAILPRAYLEVTIFGLLLIPLALLVMPSAVLGTSAFAGGLLLFDTILTSGIIYLSGDVSSDLYLTYFIIILMSASSWEFKQKIALSVVLCAAYGGVLVLAAGPTGALQEGQLIRITILLVMSVFYAVVTKTLYEERQENAALIGYIVERKRAEDALRDSEERFRRTFEDAPIGMALVSSDYRMFKVNKSLSAMLGYTEQELSQMTFVDITYAEDVDSDVRLAQQVFKGELASYQLEKRYLRKDGEIVWGLLTATAIRGQHGSSPYGLAMVENISERKQTELRQVMQLAVSQVLGEAHTLKDAAPRLLQCLCQTLGWELGEIWEVDRDTSRLRFVANWHAPTAKIAEFVTSTDRMTFASGIDLPGRALAGGEPAWIQDVADDPTFLRASLAKRVGLHGAFAIPIRSGPNISGVLQLFSQRVCVPKTELVGLMVDIGIKIGAFVRRKRAEETAHASEERFRLAVDYAHDAIFYLDGNNVILWANRQAEVVSGQSMDNIVGRTLIAVFSHQPLVKAQLASIDLGRSSSTLLEFEVFLSDGRSVWVEMNATPVQRDGTVVGRLVVARDRTERKHMEHQLRQSDKLATFGTLLGGVAHELNNPLFMISGYSQLGKEQLKQGQKEELADSLHAIQEAAQRASAIIQRSLAVARSATGARTPCEVSGLVRRALDFATNDLAIHKIELRSNLPPTPPVLADPQELTQVFLNLINNARQVMVSANGRGVLTITSTLTEDPPNRWVEVRVVDDGPGISPVHRNRIFEPFFTTKPEGQGTGLGLSICHRIVTDLKGTLTCESEPGHGATFIIRLPVMSGLNN
jgi:PAS domain S-box-containing protein